MNSLANLIYSKGWASDEVKSKLNATVVVKKDSTLYTAKYLPLILSEGELGIAATILKQASDADPQIWLFVQSFTSSGITFDSPLSQKVITALFDSVPTIRDKLLAIGLVTAIEWTQHFEVEPTDEEIASALFQVENVKWIEDIVIPKVTELRFAGGSLQTSKDEIKALIG